MAITVTTLVTGRKRLKGSQGAPFALAFTSADVSGAEVIKAAPAAGVIYLKRLVINCISAITLTLGAGETDSAPTLDLLGPINFAATSPPFILEFQNPIAILSALGVAESLVIDGSGAGAIFGVVEGFVLGSGA